MADYEYVIEILSTPVYQRTLMAWNAQTQKQMTEWYGQLQGTKSLNFNLSIPMTYMTSTGNSQGWSKNYTDSNTVSYTHGESYTKGYSENVGNSISQSLGESFGLQKEILLQILQARAIPSAKALQKGKRLASRKELQEDRP